MDEPNLARIPTRDLVLAEFQHRQLFVILTKVTSRILYLAIYITVGILTEHQNKLNDYMIYAGCILSFVWFIEVEAQRQALLRIEKAIARKEERRSRKGWEDEFILWGYFKRYELTQVGLRVVGSLEPIVWFIPLFVILRPTIDILAVLRGWW